MAIDFRAIFFCPQRFLNLGGLWLIKLSVFNLWNQRSPWSSSLRNVHKLVRYMSKFLNVPRVSNFARLITKTNSLVYRLSWKLPHITEGELPLRRIPKICSGSNAHGTTGRSIYQVCERRVCILSHARYEQAFMESEEWELKRGSPLKLSFSL